jgi:hypothetical protein
LFAGLPLLFEVWQIYLKTFTHTAIFKLACSRLKFFKLAL